MQGAVRKKQLAVTFVEFFKENNENTISACFLVLYS